MVRGDTKELVWEDFVCIKKGVIAMLDCHEETETRDKVGPKVDGGSLSSLATQNVVSPALCPDAAVSTFRCQTA